MRLFIGIKIEPTPKIIQVLSEAKKLNLKVMAEYNLHINLRFLGDVESENLADIKKALDSVKDSGSFEIKMAGIGAFPSKEFIRVVWVGVLSNELKTLKEKIDAGLEQLGFNKELSYIPHITLARVPQKIEGVASLLCEEEFGVQNIGGIHLIRSVLGPDGPEYENIYSVKL